MGFGTERLDLCYAKCYTHYEQLLRDEHLLANELGRVAKDRREDLYKRFRERLTVPDAAAQVDLGSFNAVREEDGNRVETSG